jgi:hypothetical protein
MWRDFCSEMCANLYRLRELTRLETLVKFHTRCVKKHSQQAETVQAHLPEPLVPLYGVCPFHHMEAKYEKFKFWEGL